MSRDDTMVKPKDERDVSEPSALEVCRADNGLTTASLWVLRLAKRGFSPATADNGPGGSSVVADGSHVAGLSKRKLVEKRNGIYILTPLGARILQRYEEVMR